MSVKILTTFLSGHSLNEYAQIAFLLLIFTWIFYHFRNNKEIIHIVSLLSGIYTISHIQEYYILINFIEYIFPISFIYILFLYVYKPREKKIYIPRENIYYKISPAIWINELIKIHISANQLNKKIESIILLKNNSDLAISNFISIPISSPIIKIIINGLENDDFLILYISNYGLITGISIKKIENLLKNRTYESNLIYIFLDRYTKTFTLFYEKELRCLSIRQTADIIAKIVNI